MVYITGMYACPDHADYIASTYSLACSWLLHVLTVLLSIHSCTLCHVSMIHFTRAEACLKYAVFICFHILFDTSTPLLSRNDQTLKHGDVCLRHATRKCLQFLRKS